MGRFPFVIGLGSIIPLLALVSSGCGIGTPSPPAMAPYITPIATPTSTTIATPSLVPTSTPSPSLIPIRPLAPEIQLLASLPLEEGSFLFRWHGHRFNWSADSQAISFPAGGGIWVAQFPDFTPRLLAGEMRYPVQPVWSPDSQHIAFIAGRPSNIVETVWLVNADGSGLQDLLLGEKAITGTGVARKRINRWLSSQILILKVHCGTSCEYLFSIDITSGEMKPIVSYPTGDFVTMGVEYYWGPKQEWIAVQQHNGGLNIELLDLHSGEVVELRTPFQMMQFEDWAPDGEAFLYTQWQTDRDLYHPIGEQPTSLYVWEITRGEGHKILPNVYRATWSPAGNRVTFFLLGNPVYDESGRLVDTDFVPGQPYDLYIGLLSWPEEEIVALIPIRQGLQVYGPTDAWYWFSSRLPLWAPEGQQVVYWGPDDELWIMRANGTDQLRLTQGLIRPYDESSNPFGLPGVGDILCSPDGSKLAIGILDQIFIIERPLMEQAFTSLSGSSRAGFETCPADSLVSVHPRSEGCQTRQDFH